MRLPATLVLSTLALAACGQSPAGRAASNEDARFAGLDAQIAAWRPDIEKNNAACAPAEGGGCQDFQVTCKAEREISPDERARGVTAKLVAAMTFNSQGATPDDLKPGSAFAEFTKTGDSWTRVEAQPVNLQSCAGF